jgi:cell wall-associated NlpC family hydrolase
MKWVQKMRHFSFLIIAVLLAGCTAHKSAEVPRLTTSERATQIIRDIKIEVAPDHHLAVFNVAARVEGKVVALTGEASEPKAKEAAVAAVERAGFQVDDRIVLLPDARLGAETNGISTLSVANGRENPGHAAEMGTQILMGNVFTVLKQSNSWFLVQSSDRYLSWVQRGAFVRCAKERVDAWNSSSRLLVTAYEDCILTEQKPDAQPVCDVVTGCLVKKVGEDGEWFKVELPDQRTGFLLKSSARDYAEWKAACRPSADGIERTAKTFLGRPYLWGGNSPKGMDCSGFTKLTYFLNGIELNRNASQQVLQGTEVPIDPDLSQLKKGDLLFFGFRGRRGQGPGQGEEGFSDVPVPVRGPRVTHVGIYLGDKQFIHSSEFVRINSLDPDSDLFDERRLRSLMYVRRVLP